MGTWYYRVSVSQDQGHKYERTRLLQAVAAPGIVVFGLYLKVGDFRTALLVNGALFLVAFIIAIYLPEHPSEEEAS